MLGWAYCGIGEEPLPLANTVWPQAWHHLSIKGTGQAIIWFSWSFSSVSLKWGESYLASLLGGWNTDLQRPSFFYPELGGKLTWTEQVFCSPSASLAQTLSHLMLRCLAPIVPSLSQNSEPRDMKKSPGEKVTHWKHCTILLQRGPLISSHMASHY